MTKDATHTDPHTMIQEFREYLRVVAKDFSDSDVPLSTYKDSRTREEYLGWPIERGDFDIIEDIVPQGNPSYRGGTWGRWERFLSPEGSLYVHTFHGRDEYDFSRGQLVNLSYDSVEKMTANNLVGAGRGKPFHQIKAKVESARLKALIEKEGM